MKWTGRFEGIKGYKLYRFKTSKLLNYGYPTARFDKNGIFSLIYRRNCPEADRTALISGLRQFLPFKKNITVIDHKGGATTIQLYCRLDSIPTVETMEKVENFLHTGEYFMDFEE